jgi:hypothetical protein
MARVRLSRRCRRVPTSRSVRPARRRSRSDDGGVGADAGEERGTVMVRYRARGTISVKTFTSSPSARWPWHLEKRPARRGQKTSKTSCGCRRSNLEQRMKIGVRDQVSRKGEAQLLQTSIIRKEAEIKTQLTGPGERARRPLGDGASPPE